MRKMSGRERYCLGGERVSKMRVRKIRKGERERPGCLATGGLSVRSRVRVPLG